LEFLHPVDFHDVLQWLKVGQTPRAAMKYFLTASICQALPDSPSKLIERWQSYLTHSLGIFEGWESYTAAELERKWQKAEVMLDFNGDHSSPPIDEEEVSRCWEYIMKEIDSGD
jgi:hypothetical protein